jgi:dihydropteroate synthase
MGVINVTPDSFSDGGLFFSPTNAIEHGKRLAGQGAVILDIGGESTRPGSEPVPLEEELQRVLPVIEGLAGEPGVVVSIDTSKAEVARRALDAGASIVNDVSALRHDPEMLEVIVSSDCGVVLMHMQGKPSSMQNSPTYENVFYEVYTFLQSRIREVTAAGVDSSRIVVDPGFGFGKTFEHNTSLLRRVGDFRALGCPLLMGLSRKSYLGLAVGGVPPEKRLWPGVAATAYARRMGVCIFRVHDVVENLHALRITESVLRHA